MASLLLDPRRFAMQNGPHTPSFQSHSGHLECSKSLRLTLIVTVKKVEVEKSTQTGLVWSGPRKRPFLHVGSSATNPCLLQSYHEWTRMISSLSGKQRLELRRTQCSQWATHHHHFHPNGFVPQSPFDTKSGWPKEHWGELSEFKIMIPVGPASCFFAPQASLIIL